MTEIAAFILVFKASNQIENKDQFVWRKCRELGFYIHNYSLLSVVLGLDLSSTQPPTILRRPFTLQKRYGQNWYGADHLVFKTGK